MKLGWNWHGLILFAVLVAIAAVLDLALRAGGDALVAFCAGCALWLACMSQGRRTKER
jgi:hypothetical protein